MKCYVSGYASRKTSGEESKVDVDFVHRLEKAFPWGTRQDAENECKILDGLRVTIDTPQGGKHTLEGFKVEERGPEEFVVFCVGPFTTIQHVQGTSS